MDSIQPILQSILTFLPFVALIVVLTIESRATKLDNGIEVNNDVFTKIAQNKMIRAILYAIFSALILIPMFLSQNANTSTTNDLAIVFILFLSIAYISKILITKENKFFKLVNAVIALSVLSIFGLIAYQFTIPFQQAYEFQSINNEFESGQIDSAQLRLEEFLENQPNHFEGLRLMGKIYLAQDNVTEAEDFYIKALDRTNRIEKPDYAVLTGSEFRTYGYLELAEKYYQISLEIDVDNSDAYKGLSLVRLEQKNFEEALDFGEKAYNLDSTNPVVAANLTIIYHFNEKFELRDEMLQRAKELNYESIETLEEIINGEATLFGLN